MKNKKKSVITKKILSGIVISTMLVSLAAGCAKEKDDLITLKWINNRWNTEAGEEVLAKVNEILKPEGIKLEIEKIDDTAISEQTNLRAASGELYDLVFTGYVNDYQQKADAGALYDITELLENIKMSDGSTVKMSDVVEDYMLDSALISGKIYGIPNTQVTSLPNVFVMEKPLADECGVDAEGMQELALQVKDYESSVKYMDKITEELGKIKAKKPDIYTVNPYNCNVATLQIYEPLIGGIGLRKDGSSSELVILDDTPERQYGIDTMHNWYEKGYIRSDIAAAGTAMTSTEEERQYAMLFGNWKPGQAELYFIPFRNCEPVYSRITTPYVSRTAPLQTMISVGANTKYPEECVKLIYLLNANKDLYNTLIWGIEGTHYEKGDDGRVTPIEGAGHSEIQQSGWAFGNQFNSYVLNTLPLSVWEETKQMDNEADKSPALGFAIDTSNITTELANIANLEAEYKAKIDYGTSPRSEYWDEYRSKLSAAGIEKVRDELQKQYDDFLASKN